jgi:hypothetical protein
MTTLPGGGRSYTWDPNIYGPDDTCLRCFTPVPVQDEYAFCARCGEVSMVFDVPERVTGCCKYHTHLNAIGYCVLCTKPICGDCIDYTTTPFWRPIPRHHYRDCVQRAGTIERQFFEHLGASRVCAKHDEVLAIYICKKCGLPLCSPCACFRKKRTATGATWRWPYCLTCFRQTFFGRDRKRWLPGLPR